LEDAGLAGGAYNGRAVTDKASLKKKNDEITSQFEDIKGSVTLISIIVGVMILSGIVVLLLKSQAFAWMGFSKNDLGTGIGVCILIIVVLAGIFAPVLFVSNLMDRAWGANYRTAWSWLKYTDLPRFMVDQAAWDRIFTIIDGSMFLKAGRITMPQTVEEQIELASDFRNAIMVLTRGARDGDEERFTRSLARAVYWGGTTRFLDNLVVWLFNSCASFGCLIVGGIFWYGIALPIWIPLLGLYIRRQAWQTAMCDFLNDKPTSPVKGVKKPAGFD